MGKRLGWGKEGGREGRGREGDEGERGTREGRRREGERERSLHCIYCTVCKYTCNLINNCTHI